MTKTGSTRAQLSGWWHDAVMYQIFMPSFADGNGDGLGDFPGIIRKLPYLAELGVDAVWFTPFYISPQADTGYDVADYCSVDPRYGTLNDFDRMVKKAHALGLKVIIDIVPNHTSIEHKWFKQALAAGPGSPQRDRYFFRDGRGEHGELPPNNWISAFGGPAWKRIEGEKQWYLHIFAPEQADLNWHNPVIRAEFDHLMRFWLDRGVDGLRIDAPIHLYKAPGLPDLPEPVSPDHVGAMNPLTRNQPGVHEIFKAWRKLMDEYGDRCLIGEVFAENFEQLLTYVHPDEFNQCFNFNYEAKSWGTEYVKPLIDLTLAGMEKNNAELVWVTSSHDVVRVASRLGLTSVPTCPIGIDRHMEQPERLLGLRRARALPMLTLFLPGSICLYYGEELGLPDHTTMEGKYRRDPRYVRSNGTDVGRDGSRCPLPWRHDARAFGFSSTGKSWLPQPALYKEYAVDVQQGDKDSTWALYNELLFIRQEYGLGRGQLEWLDSSRADVLRARNGQLELVINMGYTPIEMPEGEIIAQSTSDISEDDDLPGNAAVWILHED